jgi:hypothetical protein
MNFFVSKCENYIFDLSGVFSIIYISDKTSPRCGQYCITSKRGRSSNYIPKSVADEMIKMIKSELM